jgi:hypothetical protein
VRFTDEEALTVTSFASGVNTTEVIAASLATLEGGLMSDRPELSEQRSCPSIAGEVMVPHRLVSCCDRPAFSSATNES